MRLGRMLAAAVVSASLASTPVMAAAGSASALSVSASLPRAGADMKDENDLAGGFIIPLLVAAAVIAAVLVIVDDDEEAPSSP